MDRRLARLVVRGGLVALLLAGLQGTSVLVSNAAGATTGTWAPRAKLYGLTNDARERHDRRDVSLNALLCKYAHRHSLDMAAKGYLYHSDSDRLIRLLQPYHFSIGGENVGVGSNVDVIQQAFMNSPEHRQNILRREFRHVAIGTAQVDGHMWVTVIFYG